MNNQTPISETARRGLNALHRAVRKEVEKKSKLGQYVIISRQGKTVRILAADALRFFLVSFACLIIVHNRISFDFYLGTICSL